LGCSCPPAQSYPVPPLPGNYQPATSQQPLTVGGLSFTRFPSMSTALLGPTYLGSTNSGSLGGGSCSCSQ
jgi:hypothetical protein